MHNCKGTFTNDAGEVTSVSCPFNCTEFCQKERVLARNAQPVKEHYPEAEVFSREELEFMEQTKTLSSISYFKALRERIKKT